MATRHEHYQLAEKYLDQALTISAAAGEAILDPNQVAALTKNIDQTLAVAQIHATLAAAGVEGS